MSTVIHDPATIAHFRLLCIRSGLRLEAAGMRRRGIAAAVLARQELTAAGIKPARGKAELLTQFTAWVEAQG